MQIPYDALFIYIHPYDLRILSFKCMKSNKNFSLNNRNISLQYLQKLAIFIN